MRLLAIVSVVLLACAEDEQTPPETSSPSEPSGWVRVESACGYGFHAPADLMKRTVAGIDSCVDQWASASCVYSGDYGAFSSPLTEFEDSPGYAQTQESIDGREAKLVTAVSDDRFVAGVNFPQVHQGSDIRLTLVGMCEDEAGQDDAVRVLKSITFAP